MSRRKQQTGFVYLVIGFIVFAAPAVGNLVGDPGGAWYASLVRPALAPPNWVFGPVWTVLYLLLAISTMLAWREAKKSQRKTVLVAFAINITLNAIWSPVFFGYQNIGLALIVILATLLSILYMIATYARVKRLYGWLNVPYLLWVSFATLLNVQFWLLN